MTSKQVMLTVAVLLMGGCPALERQGADPLESPYPSKRVWAVAPLRNESGSLQADGVLMADHLARQLENAVNIDVMPVNRTLSAMETMGLRQVSSPDEAMRLLGLLGADGLVVGTITAYDPYDPPKLGMAIELYTAHRVEEGNPTDARRLVRTGKGEGSLPVVGAGSLRQPVGRVSGFFDASNPEVRQMMKRYASDRGSQRGDSFEELYLNLNWGTDDDQEWRLYRISMDLYSEFVGYVMSWRLMFAENQRVAPVAARPAP
jgi:hypothetical protein